MHYVGPTNVAMTTASVMNTLQSLKNAPAVMDEEKGLDL
jgi:hypothetical protein